MHPSVKKTLNIAAAIMIVILIMMVVAIVSVYRESQKIEERVQSKIDRTIVPPTLKIVKYDSLTQAKLDTIETRRSLSHRHVDNMYDGELQSLLDSMYNGR